MHPDMLHNQWDMCKDAVRLFSPLQQGETDPTSDTASNDDVRVFCTGAH